MNEPMETTIDEPHERNGRHESNREYHQENRPDNLDKNRRTDPHDGNPDNDNDDRHPKAAK